MLYWEKNGGWESGTKQIVIQVLKQLFPSLLMKMRLEFGYMTSLLLIRLVELITGGEELVIRCSWEPRDRTEVRIATSWRESGIYLVCYSEFTWPLIDFTLVISIHIFA